MLTTQTFPLIFSIIFLFLFGLFFNLVTGRLQKAGFAEGYTWLLVVVGTAVTLIAAGILLGWEIFLVLLALFAASGSPMAAGDIYRYWQARKKEQEL